MGPPEEDWRSGPLFLTLYEVSLFANVYRGKIPLSGHGLHTCSQTPTSCHTICLLSSLHSYHPSSCYLHIYPVVPSSSTHPLFAKITPTSSPSSSIAFLLQLSLTNTLSAGDGHYTFRPEDKTSWALNVLTSLCFPYLSIPRILASPAPSTESVGRSSHR